ncbi:MAG: hypothetical protein ACRDHL_14800 [Candidatus Promineifilaceae bacterium]
MNPYKRGYSLALAAAALVAAALSGCATGSEAQQLRELPTVVPAQELTPAPTPADGRQVAILQLVVLSNADGRVEEVRLEKGQIVTAFAPNVFGRAGAWTVELVGRTPMRFGVPDPREAHIEDGEEGAPHTTEILAEVSWELVVPLSDKGQPLGVEEIRILDQNGELIFSTPVDREAWGGAEAQPNG